MKRIAGISTSSSSQSINKNLLHYALKQLGESSELIMLNQQLPIYSIDLEKEKGIPDEIRQLFEKIKQFDGLVIALPEHNGSMTALFKNTLDWLSRIDKNIFGDKPVMLLSTSPGPNGGKFGLAHVKTLIPFLGAKVVSGFSLNSFYENFQNGIVSNSLENVKLKSELQNLKTAL